MTYITSHNSQLLESDVSSIQKCGPILLLELTVSHLSEDNVHIRNGYMYEKKQAINLLAHTK